MNIKDALQLLGVRDDTLSREEKRRLDEDGYLTLSNMLSEDEVRAFANRLDELLEEEGDQAGIEVHQEEGTARLANLVNKDPMFEICFTHPRLLAAMVHVLGHELKLNSLNSRSALPGAGLQGLHSDWGSPVAPGDYYICNSGWLLDDFTAENGATRIVPGSHRREKRPQDVLEDGLATQPDEIQALAPAGSVLVFNSHLWHGGALNKTAAARHSFGFLSSRSSAADQSARIPKSGNSGLIERCREMCLGCIVTKIRHGTLIRTCQFCENFEVRLGIGGYKILPNPSRYLREGNRVLGSRLLNWLMPKESAKGL